MHAGRRYADALIVVVGVSALAYVATRAVLVPLTYDEAISAARYVTGPVAGLFDFATATNHVLASALSRLTVGIFGDAPWVLRLPTVVAAAIGLAAAGALARRTANAAIGAGGFVAIAANPYLLEYFALSRGYGIAVALVLVACWSLAHQLERTADARRRRRAVVLGAGAGALAVAANFATLPVVVAWALAVVVLGVSAGAAAFPPTPVRTPWPALAMWVAASTAMALAVFSQARLLPSREFVETTVRVSGLYHDEIETIRLYRVDATGRLREVRQREPGVWRLGRVRDPWDQLRMILPRLVERQVVSLDVTSGSSTWAHRPASTGPWRVVDVGAVDRVLVSQAPLGWRPDSRRRQRVLEHTGIAALVLVAMAVAAVALGRVASTRRLVGPELWWPVAWAGLAVVGVAAVPVYLLQRDGELFFGGTTGVVTDAVGSLVSATLYDHRPSPRIAATLAGVMVALAVGVASSRARCTASGRACLAFGGMLAVLSAMAEGLHGLVGTPFPLGRTALVWLPLIVLFVTFATDALAATFTRRTRTSTTAALIVASLALTHATRSANLRTTFDWPADSATPAVLAQIADERRDRPDGALRLAVDWDLYPVVRYYAGRTWPNPASYDVVVLPGDDLPVDYVYARPGSDGAAVPDRTAPPPTTMPVLRRTEAP